MTGPGDFEIHGELRQFFGGPALSIVLYILWDSLLLLEIP